IRQDAGDQFRRFVRIDDLVRLSEERGCLDVGGKDLAIAVDDIEQFIQLNRQVEKPHCPLHELTDLLVQSRNACSKGVTRAHILDADIDGVLPAEIFSDLGSGTMIYKNNYGTFRTMVREDIPAVLSLMHPFVEQGILLQRTSSDLESTTADFIVYEIDGGIRACAALHTYPDPAGNATESAGNATESVGNAAGSAGNTTGSAGATTSPIGEIAGLAVDESYAHMGIGPKLMELLIQKGKSSGMKILFVLTTRTADWFERFGFKPADISILPEKRREKWSQSRASRVLVLSLTH
ncbi:MAG TPA: GNAT family N-acetyltransferase, partial [Treponemataceae bacterium]|nr:GNAT family N-acetyltransferase [Treponemataceae bacterium]